MSTETKAFELKSSAGDGAAVTILRVRYGIHRKGDFNLALTGDGFEASRYLSPEEMADLRDWITSALDALGPTLRTA